MQQISYDELKVIAKRVASSILAQHGQNYALVAVARGGLTFAHLVSYYLAAPLNFFNPKLGQMMLTQTYVRRTQFIFLEDVIAEGRTFRIIDAYVTANEIENWEVIPVIVDENAPSDIQARVNTYGMKTNAWMVFPHEEFDLTLEGDRGLFRDGTSSNSQSAV